MEMTNLTQHDNGLWLPSFDEWWMARMHPDKNAAFEPEVLAAGVKFCKNLRTALDIGAHIGTSVRYLAHLFHKVEAFEPHPLLIECLTKNTSDLALDVRIHRMALGAWHGNCQMSYHGDTSGEYYVVPGSGPILILPLDDFCFHEVDFMKLDVEGYELRILEGARKTILENRPVILFETANCTVLNHGIARDAAEKFLESLGMLHLADVHNFSNKVYGFEEHRATK